MPMEVVVWLWEVLSPWPMRHGNPCAPHRSAPTLKGRAGETTGLRQRSANLSVKDYIIYIFGFGCNIIFVAITQLCHYSIKTTIDNT